MNRLLDRLSRRGVVTITADAGHYSIEVKAPGPYRGRAWCSTDEADLYEYCRFGAKSWTGEGSDLDALLVLAEIESRPNSMGPDDIRWAVAHRRDARTAGPPLPTYRRWHGWSPGEGRWLRTFSHHHEYLDGYRRDLAEERSFEALTGVRDREHHGDVTTTKGR